MIVRKRARASSRDSALLKENRDYPVFALLMGETVSFLIEEKDSLSFPFFVDESSVDVVDRHLPEAWKYLSRTSASTSVSSRPIMIAPEEFEDSFFYQRLVDGDLEALRQWRRLKDGMSAMDPGTIGDVGNGVRV